MGEKGEIEVRIGKGGWGKEESGGRKKDKGGGRKRKERESEREV